MAMDDSTYEEFFEAFDKDDVTTIIGLIESQRLGLDELFDYGAVIHCASFSGNVEFAQRLIELGANVNISNDEDGLTPLHAAVGYNQVSTARFLIQNGADMHAKTKFGGRSEYSWAPHCGETALHLAAAYSVTEMVQLLLDAGADPNAQDCVGATPQEYLRRIDFRKYDTRDFNAIWRLLETVR